MVEYAVRPPHSDFRLSLVLPDRRLCLRPARQPPAPAGRRSHGLDRGRLFGGLRAHPELDLTR